MVSLQHHLNSLLKSLTPAPVDQSKLDEAVVRVLNDTKDDTWPENRKTQWEQILRNDIFQLAVSFGDWSCRICVLKAPRKATEGIALKNGAEKYYLDLSTKLDLVLTFTEHGMIQPYNYPAKRS